MMAAIRKMCEKWRARRDRINPLNVARVLANRDTWLGGGGGVGAREWFRQAAPVRKVLSRTSLQL